MDGSLSMGEQTPGGGLYMEVCGWLWELMRVMGVWEYMGFYRCLGVYGYLWMAMEVYAYYWCL